MMGTTMTSIVMSSDPVKLHDELGVDPEEYDYEMNTIINKALYDSYEVRECTSPKCGANKCCVSQDTSQRSSLVVNVILCFVLLLSLISIYSSFSS